MSTKTEREKHRLTQMATLRDRYPETRGARDRKANQQQRDSQV